MALKEREREKEREKFKKSGFLFTPMGELEEKMVRILQLQADGKTVKMRKAKSVVPVKGVELLHNIVLIEFQDGELLLLTREQFLNREIIVEEKEKITDVEKRVEEMLKAIDKLRKRGYSVYYKGKKIEEIRQEGEQIVVRTSDGTIYKHKLKEFLNAYKTARREKEREESSGSHYVIW